MELRLLRYFLTVAKEQSFTKAAEQLHITQPTLSRQMAAFEEDLGITLFIRNGKKISLTDEGILLKRRALEILNLEERTLEELKGKEEVVEGTITIGCGEFAAVETLAEICKTYKEKYPLVQIVLHTATADAVYEMMNKGLVDIVFQIYHMTVIDATARGLKHPKFWGVFTMSGNNSSGLLMYLIGRRKYPIVNMSESNSKELEKRKKSAGVGLLFLAIGVIGIICATLI